MPPEHIPKISVGMPVYNGEVYLESAIDSILGQSEGDFELLISDNASTDKTQEICSDYKSQDSRIRYFRNAENLGAAENYNQVFRRARAPYFRWFNGDDLSEPELHSKCLHALDTNPDAVLSYGRTHLINDDGGFIQEYSDNLNLGQASPVDRYKAFFAQVGLTNIIYGLMKTDVLKNTFLMGNGKFPAADINLMAELTLYGKFIEIDEFLFSRRMHEQASSWQRDDNTVQEHFWSGGSYEFKLPSWKSDYSNLVSVWRSPISIYDKNRLTRYILSQMYKNKRALAKEILQIANL